MEFVRSEPLTFPNGTVPDPREHVNAISAWIDGSMIYGSDKERAKSLRSRNGTGALLATKLYKGKERLPEGDEKDCINLKPDHYCGHAGDDRVNEQPGLRATHLLFVLEHNRLTRKLARAVLYRTGRPYTRRAVEHYLRTAPNKIQDRMYQVVRKVLSAVWTNIVYGEYLPLIIGPKLMTRYKLWTGRRAKYDANIQPSIAQEFLSCAFRYGHTLVNDMMLTDEMKQLKDLFSTSGPPLEHYDNILKGMVTKVSHSEVFDTHISKALVDNLFENREDNDGLDLAALNIQRGRDHGIPRYNEMRKHFGLKPVTDWREFGDIWQNMEGVYDDLEDVECFPGGTAEKSVEGGVVGELFAHIIGLQFHDLKYGDRHFFETDSSHHGFTNRELHILSKLCFSKILCENTNLQYIQKNPFKHAHDDENPYYRCDQYPDFDMWFMTNYVI